MLKSLGKCSDLAPVLLRVGLGITQFAAHGMPKILEGPERWVRLGGAMQAIGIGFAPTFWGFMAAATEVVGGLFLIIGLFVRPTSLVLTFVMFVAAAENLVDTGNLTGGRAHPVDMGVGLIALLVLGAGKWSLDRKLGLDGLGQKTRLSEPARAETVI